MRRIVLLSVILLASAAVSGCVDGRDYSSYHSRSTAATTYHGATSTVGQYPSGQSTSMHGYSTNEYPNSGGYGSSMNGYASG